MKVTALFCETGFRMRGYVCVYVYVLVHICNLDYKYKCIFYYGSVKKFSRYQRWQRLEVQIPPRSKREIHTQVCECICGIVICALSIY